MKKLTIEDFKRVFKKRKPTVQGNYRYYAVLVPLVDKGGDLHLLYEVRSDTLSIQPGEVCFPGGRIEAGETPKECAIRETCEELNIKPDDIKLIAQLDIIQSYSNFTMYPFLGAIDYSIYETMQVNSEEVKEVFLIPISYFLDHEPLLYHYEVLPEGIENFPYEKINSKNYKWRRGKTTIPIYEYPEYTVWGLTALITHHLIHIIKEDPDYNTIDLYSS